MAELQPPYALQGPVGAGTDHPADSFRRPFMSAIRGAEGIQFETHLLVRQSAVPAMSVRVDAGRCFIRGNNRVQQGTYHGVNDATITLPIAASNPVNPRIDLVCATILDSVEDGGIVDQFVLQVITGVPSGVPLVPATPVNSIPLAEILIPALDAAITTSQITDRRYLWVDMLPENFYVMRAVEAAFVIPADAWTAVSGWTEEYDPASILTGGTNFTIPADGRYRLEFYTTILNGVQGYIRIMLDAVEATAAGDYAPGAHNARLNCSTEIDCLAGQIVQFQAYHFTVGKTLDDLKASISWVGRIPPGTAPPPSS